jgi:hypothetical protein
VPQAKTQEEYAAYNTVAAQADVAAAEIAANDFAQKFPQSELTSLLYGQLMQKYYSQNKPDKTIEMGRKTLKLDPSNPLHLQKALVRPNLIATRNMSRPSATQRWRSRGLIAWYFLRPSHRSR